MFGSSLQNNDTFVGHKNEVHLPLGRHIAMTIDIQPAAESS